jgi:hypothetical protein
VTERLIGSCSWRYLNARDGVWESLPRRSPELELVERWSVFSVGRMTGSALLLSLYWSWRYRNERDGNEVTPAGRLDRWLGLACSSRTIRATRNERHTRVKPASLFYDLVLFSIDWPLGSRRRQWSLKIIKAHTRARAQSLARKVSDVPGEGSSVNEDWRGEVGTVFSLSDIQPWRIWNERDWVILERKVKPIGKKICLIRTHQYHIESVSWVDSVAVDWRHSWTVDWDWQ